MSKSYYNNFANTVLLHYYKSPDRFWEVTMAPFLNQNPTLIVLKNSRLTFEILHQFKEVHKDAMHQLTIQGKALNLDLVNWKSLKSKIEYFTDAYPIYAFLAIWMSENKLNEILSDFHKILEAVVDGIAGYGILDVIVDSTSFSPVELLTAQYLIADYEMKILSVFGYTQTNQEILHHIRAEYLKAEILEKSVRFIKSPYPENEPIHCGTKAAHLLTPFMLSLEKLKKQDLIDSYFQIFYQFGAVIQILDDIKDLEEDLAIGHYAYITHGTSTIDDLKAGISIKAVVESLLQNKHRLTSLRDECRDLINQAKLGLQKINDPLLLKIVDVTELRMESMFKNDLKL